MRISPRARVIWVSAAYAVAAIVVGLIALFASRLSSLRAQRASGPNWGFPSRVYSAGVAFEVGRLVPGPYLTAQLEAREYRRTTTRPSPGTYRVIPGGFEIGLRGLPDEPPPIGGGGPEAVRLRIADGRLTAVQRLGAFPGALRPDSTRPPGLEPALISLIFGEDRVWRSWVSLERVPKPVQDAIVSAEDRRFFRHIGFDARGTMRALFTNVRTGEIREGGSTITQQLARSLFLGNQRTVTRKLGEIPLALGIEIMLSKEQILEMYLNSVYWGQARGLGIGGVAEAARWYFDAPIESLGVLEGATLAAIIPAPNAINPFTDPAKALERRNAVLEDMVATKRLSRSAAAALAVQPLGVRQGRLPIERYPSYVGYVESVLEDRLARHAGEVRGLAVMTTMDLAWQRMAEESLAEGLAALGGRRRHGLEGAFIALAPETSEILAIVGGRAIGPGDFNRATQARRQTGSAIKPMVYAAALDGPRGLTPATTLSDTLRTFGRGRHAWRPRNYDGSTHAEVTVAKALEKSLNIATANLVEMIGPAQVAEAAERFGLGRLKPVPSIGLGTSETSLLALTNAYAVFRDQGMLHSPSPIRAVVDRSGRTVLEPERASVQVVSSGIAALMTGLLQNVVRYGVAYPLRGHYGFDRPVAGKTGTTDDYRDAWFLGYTPDVIAGVWLGYDRPRSIGRQAAHTALPVWARVVGLMLRGFPPSAFASDGQLEWLNIDPWRGFLADSLCPSESVPFLPGTGPFTSCSDGWLYGYEYENLDSLYADDPWAEPPPDSSWFVPEYVDTLEPEPEIVDTVEVEPDTMGGDWPGRPWMRPSRDGPR